MAADLQQLLSEIESLSPEDLRTVREKIESLRRETPEEAYSRRLREMGIVRQPRLPRDPNQPPNPTPISVEGEPVSETLIRERR